MPATPEAMAPGAARRRGSGVPVFACLSVLALLTPVQAADHPQQASGPASVAQSHTAAADDGVHGSDLGMYLALIGCALVVAQQMRRRGPMKVVLS